MQMLEFEVKIGKISQEAMQEKGYFHQIMKAQKNGKNDMKTKENIMKARNPILGHYRRPKPYTKLFSDKDSVFSGN